MATNNKTKKTDPFTPSVKRHTDPAIVLPTALTYDEAINWLQTAKTEENRVAEDTLVIDDYYPLDALAAFDRALQKVVGFVKRESNDIRVPISPTDSIAVPYGGMTVPGSNIEFAAAIRKNANGRPIAVIAARSKVRHRQTVEAVFDAVHDELVHRSIYKGKAVSIDLSFIRGGSAFDPIQHAPRFIPIDNTVPPIFPEVTQTSLDVGLLSLIRHTDWCRNQKIPLRGGVLVCGPYGCGKTSLARAVAVEATTHGWTFLHLLDVRDIAEAYRMAKRYAPAIVFAEDIDRVTAGERTVDLDNILNTVDGVDSKNDEVICVYTSNHPERISKAMIRPGRIDTIVPILPPDSATAARLVREFGGQALEPNLDLTGVGDRIAGMIPATIRTVVEKAKRIALMRAGTAAKVNAADLLKAAEAMRLHTEFLNDTPAPSPVPTLDQAMREIVRGVVDTESANA